MSHALSKWAVPFFGTKYGARKKRKRKSGDDVPVRIAQAIVRIQNPETRNRAIVEIAEGKPPGHRHAP